MECCLCKNDTVSNYQSKRIRNCLIWTYKNKILHSVNSDSSVGVKHDSKSWSHSTRGKVLCELCLNETRISVIAHYFTPHSFELSSSLFVFTSVNVCNALSMVPVGCFWFVNILNLKDSLVFLLSTLCTFEVQKHCLLVESAIDQL